jgi:hypothetical protein
MSVTQIDIFQPKKGGLQCDEIVLAGSAPAIDADAGAPAVSQRKGRG